MPPDSIPSGQPAELRRENGDIISLQSLLPFGYHRLTVDDSGRLQTCTIIAAPEQAWLRGPIEARGISTHLAALRSGRSRSLGDLRDLQSVCRWVRERGGDLVTILPLLPTFNSEPPEPSPYSPVRRLFWSELFLDLEDAHRPSTIGTPSM